MNVLLVSSYELGHQPFHVASAAAALRAVGHEVRTGDLARQQLADADVDWAEGVAFAVPMHTAMIVALQAAVRIAEKSPEMPVCFYGLYASAAELPEAATVITGEYEPGLVAWAAGDRRGSTNQLGRSAVEWAPDRSGLGELHEYVGLEIGGERLTVGSTAGSRGCRYLCRHCPVPAIYNGKFRVVGHEIVAQDIAAQVKAGAQHISFSDPDFLNGPIHAMRILEQARSAHPGLTFDATIKVEHLLKHRNLLPRMAELGVIFVVSAFETTNDEILRTLDKGHTRADMAEAVHLLRAEAIDVRPTWLPFTPWTRMSDLVDMLAFMNEHDLDVDPIQLTIRLLIPRGSLLLELSRDLFNPGDFEAAALSHTWQSHDPLLDRLQARLVDLVESTFDLSPQATLDAVTGEILGAAGLNEDAIRLRSGEERPRLTEPWFC